MGNDISQLQDVPQAINLTDVTTNTTCKVLVDLSLNILQEMSSTAIPTINTDSEEMEELFVQKFKQVLIPSTIQG